MLDNNGTKFKPNILEGISRIVDFNGLLNDHHERLLSKEDWDALFSDWEKLGEDFRVALEKVLSEDNGE